MNMKTVRFGGFEIMYRGGMSSPDTTKEKIAKATLVIEQASQAVADITSPGAETFTWMDWSNFKVRLRDALEENRVHLIRRELPKTNDKARMIHVLARADDKVLQQLTFVGLVKIWKGIEQIYPGMPCPDAGIIAASMIADSLST